MNRKEKKLIGIRLRIMLGKDWIRFQSLRIRLGKCKDQIRLTVRIRLTIGLKLGLDWDKTRLQRFRIN
jgi:hypothetical protein